MDGCLRIYLSLSEKEMMHFVSCLENFTKEVCLDFVCLYLSK